MSSSRASITDMFSGTFAAFQYPQMLPQALQPGNYRAEPVEPKISFTEEELAERIAGERAAATAETEERLRSDYDGRVQLEKSKISTAVSAFEDTRKAYFSKVEAEVVQLSVAIAS